MYQVLDKDIIKMEILSYLSVTKRSYPIKNQLVDIINAILHKLNMGKGNRVIFQLKDYFRSLLSH